MPIIRINVTPAELRFLKKLANSGWAVPKAEPADPAGRWSWAVPDQAAPEMAVPQTTQVPQAASDGWGSVWPAPKPPPSDRWTSNMPDGWGLPPPSKADGWGSSF
jgi:hypothetical protein